MSEEERLRRLGLSRPENDAAAMEAETKEAAAPKAGPAWAQAMVDGLNNPPSAAWKPCPPGTPPSAQASMQHDEGNDYGARHMKTVRRMYVNFVLWWLAVAFAGCLAGAVHDGARSILPNFLRYGMGGGAVLSLILAAAYLADRLLLRRKT